MEATTNFLKMYILTSGLIPEEELGFIKTYLEIRREFKKPQEVTFDDFINFASGKIKRGLKNTTIHRRVFKTMIDIFQKNRPEYVLILENGLPKEQEVEEEI